MTEMAQRHIEGFLAALCARGIPVLAPRRINFLRALTVTDLTSVDDVYWTARVMLVSGVAQIEAFDEVFDIWFRGRLSDASQAHEYPDETTDPSRPPDGSDERSARSEPSEGLGRDVSWDEVLQRPTLPTTEGQKRELCVRITGEATVHLPRTGARRTVRSHRRGIFDVRRILADMTRTGGEIVRLTYRRRPVQLRRVLLLVDVSGSLKATSPDALRFTHALAKAADRMEVFVFGTRLTRVTRALRFGEVDNALARFAELVFDFDGGTRIGPSFETFLGNSQFLSLARGALVIVVSDGLERGDIDPMARATERMARLAHRLVWLTPLMCDPAYRPATRGIQAILGSLDRLGDASSLSALLTEVVQLRDVEMQPRRRAKVQWQESRKGTKVDFSQRQFVRF